MRLSEQTKIEAQIGFQCGILVGVLSSWVIILTTNWEWYYKLFSSIGEAGIVGSLIFSLIELFKMRKNYLNVQTEMAKMNVESNNKLGEQNGAKKESPL